MEEDYLYAYGFVSRDVWRLLHPRTASRVRALENKVLDIVRRLGEAHPRALEKHLGRKRVVNAWGGYSKATTNALEWLHWRGLVRIARREAGVRIYTPTTGNSHALADHERLRELILVNARIFAPSPLKSLAAVASRYGDLGNPRRTLDGLIHDGVLDRQSVEDVDYVWPSGVLVGDAPPHVVRFLAPFDPLVWDRARFAHLWRWEYRFEAYTPVAKRVRGYYAMPLLWGEHVIGWANVTTRNGKLDVELGFTVAKPRGAEFRRELDAEIARLEEFLTSSGCSTAKPFRASSAPGSE